MLQVLPYRATDNIEGADSLSLCRERFTPTSISLKIARVYSRRMRRLGKRRRFILGRARWRSNWGLTTTSLLASSNGKEWSCSIESIRECWLIDALQVPHNRPGQEALSWGVSHAPLVSEALWAPGTWCSCCCSNTRSWRAKWPWVRRVNDRRMIIWHCVLTRSHTRTCMIIYLMKSY